MKQFPKLTVGLVWLFATLGTFAVGVAATVGVAGLTNSGLGSCGPYGPAFTLLEWMLIASFPASLIAGFYAAWRTHKCLSRGDS